MWTYFLGSFIAGLVAPSKPMTVVISNVQPGKGSVMVAVFNKEKGFLDPESALYKQSYGVKSVGAMSVVIPDLPEGTYALSCFQDINGNKYLDKNIFGVPTESYGFSGGSRPKFRAPTWTETKFWFNGDAVQLKLETW
jgi:uncharacterized protein (DUF2141 family)